MLKTLDLTSNHRILPYCERSKDGDIETLRIPVRQKNEGDKKDSVLRRYIKDWFRLRRKDLGVDARWEDVKGQSYYDDEGEEYTLTGLIVVRFWPKPEETDEDKRPGFIRRRQAAE